jgi:hypothetical protein
MPDLFRSHRFKSCRRCHFKHMRKITLLVLAVLSIAVPIVGCYFCGYGVEWVFPPWPGQTIESPMGLLCQLVLFLTFSIVPVLSIQHFISACSSGDIESWWKFLIAKEKKPEVPCLNPMPADWR